MYDEDYEDYEDYEDEETQEKEPLLDSELANECRKKLETILGKDHDGMERLVKDFIDKAKYHMIDVMKKYTSEVVKALWVEYLEKEGIELIKAKFKEALTGIVNEETNEKYVQTTIQNTILNKIKSFMSSNYKQRDGRREIINDSIDEAIAKVVNQKVEVALEELKKETIEKFQKDAMKKMMQGMAREIAGDKKLLALMTE